MKLWAAIDIMGGRVVSLLKGNANSPRDWATSPAEAARRWESEGADGLHVVDLDRAFGIASNERAIQEIVKEAGIPVQVGGGIRTASDALNLLAMGASRLVVGTLAYVAPSALRELVRRVGTESVAVALDYKGDRVLIHGWTRGGGMSLLEAVDYARGLGVRTLVVTAVERDGTAAGPDLDTYRKLRQSTKLGILASGGIHSYEDLRSLNELGVEGAILGRGLYEGTIVLPGSGRATS